VASASVGALYLIGIITIAGGIMVTVTVVGSDTTKGNQMLRGAQLGKPVIISRLKKNPSDRGISCPQTAI
jgi:hypothetical protein